MVCGLFGKLPAKRDFISCNMPRPFLDHWERWLQEGVARSQLQLGRQWKDVFLTAPIWRFWFGAEVYGQSVTGALMPSVDGVGRYFPLTVCSFAEDGRHHIPPPDEAVDAWLGQCEQFLLGLLEDSLPDEPSAMLISLPDAPTGKDNSDGYFVETDGVQLSSCGGLAESYSALTRINTSLFHAKRSYWWTAGGGAYAARFAFTEGAADSSFFNFMISGMVDHANAG
jgi:type VI secretion system protein ImpM